MDATTNLWTKLTRAIPFRTFVNEDINVAQASLSGMNSIRHPASTFIQRISYEPRSNMVFVRMGNRMYYYPMTETELNAWLTSKSLGHWYNEHLKLK